MTAAELQQTNARAAKQSTTVAGKSRIHPSGPLRIEELPNPQQGMADPSAVSVNTAGAATSNTACTSPLTVTSLEQAAAAAAAGGAIHGGAVAGGAVPAVVSGVVPAVPIPTKPAAAPTVETMMNQLCLGQPPHQGPPVIAAAARGRGASPPHRPMPPAAEKKGGSDGPRATTMRTPPTEHDERKLFVGGLPTDVSDRDFLDFFRQFGEVIDSVVIIDRITKRSRGFGFVTFADEKYANSLLTHNPGRTGYVVINGKQCEVKASTPKTDDGPSYKPGHHHHGGGHNHHGPTGLWRSNPPRHDHHRGGGYAGPRHPVQTKTAAAHQDHAKPAAQKQFGADDEFDGDEDGRNFDEVQTQQPARVSYQQTVYGRNMYTSQPFYYQGAYLNSAGPYSNAGSGASVPSSYDASYPAAAGPGQGYAGYVSASVPGNNSGYNNGYGYNSGYNSGYNGGYYDPYAAQQYPNQYGNAGSFGGSQFAGYPNASVPPPAPAMSMGYASYGGGYNAENNGYNNAESNRALLPSQAAVGGGGDEGFEPYPPSYANDDGEYEQPDGAERYE